MRKKYLSALLFGALLFASAGTFTSCKDYDDDINNLQGQIDENEASLTEKLAAVESSISSLQSAQSAMQAAIDAAQQAADDAAAAAAQAEANAIAAATEQLESVKAELTELINQGDSALQSDIDAVNATIGTINGQIETLTAMVNKHEEAVSALQEANTQLEQSIAGLNEQVKANATAIGNLQAGLKTQEDALKAYQESNDADVAGILTDVEELQAKIAELAGSEDMGTLQNQIDEIRNACQTVSDQIDQIDGLTNALFFAWYEGVTGVSLTISNVADYNAQNIQLLSAVAVADNTFGEELKDNSLFQPIANAPMAFEEGERTRLQASFLMRVYPVTATPAAEDIRLINSAGEDLTESQVEVISVEKYDGVLTRAASSTGLWKVTLGVKEDTYSDLEFDAMTTRINGNKIEYPLFAVAIEDTRVGVTNQENRKVVSEYNLTFANNAKAANDRLQFTVNNKRVEDIYNRATHNADAVIDDKYLPTEYEWIRGAQAKPIWEGGLQNVKEGDNRSWHKPYLNVTSKEDITIQLTDKMLESVVAYYVVLDKNCTTSSDESELTAWNTFEPSIEGINTLYKTSETNGKITLRFTEDINDVIGFRVFAVNANGTLVDPDGRSFYVKVGKSAQAEAATVTANIVPFLQKPALAQVVADIDGLDAAKQLLDSRTRYTIEYTIDDVFRYVQNDPNNREYSRGNAFTWSMLDENGSPVYIQGIDPWEDRTSGVSTTSDFTATDFAKVEKIQLLLNKDAEWIDYTDDKTYTGKLTIKDEKKNVIAVINISFEKLLPLADQLPTNFDWKDTQYVNGAYACYLTPDKLWNATLGLKGLDEIFNFGEYGEYEPSRYVITFNTADGSERYNTEYGVNGYPVVAIKKGSIDNETQYDVVVTYNFGKISSVNPTVDVTATKTYKATYNCYYHQNCYELKWDETYSYIKSGKLEITYGSDFKIYDSYGDLRHIDALIKGTSSYDSIFDDTLYNLINGNGKGLVRINGAKLISNGTQQEDYFKVLMDDGIHIDGFKFIATTANPTEDVESTLVITIEDMYGHVSDVIFPVVVKKR